MEIYEYLSITKYFFYLTEIPSRNKITSIEFVYQIRPTYLVDQAEDPGGGKDLCQTSI